MKISDLHYLRKTGDCHPKNIFVIFVLPVTRKIYFICGLTSDGFEPMLRVEIRTSDEMERLGRTEDRESGGLVLVASAGDPGDCLAAIGRFSVLRDGPQSARVGIPHLAVRPIVRVFSVKDFVIPGSSLYCMTIS
jgi:hypothetical protein